jgi:iron(III) transport system substrate-binding protein
VVFGLVDTDDGRAAARDGADVEVVYPGQEGSGALVMPTVVVLLRGGRHPMAARRLVDHLLDAAPERRFAGTGAHLSLRPGGPVPKGQRRLSEIKAMVVDPAAVAEALERIQPRLRQWVGL